jgi:ribonuclease T2
MRLALSLLLVGCHSATPPPQPSPPKSDFGFYLLAMMWSPPACSLTLHGLWPNYTDAQSAGQPRAWPQFCGSYAHCEKAEDASCAPGAPVPAELAPLAPEYVHGTLATHEWSKHGSCTALPAAEYFTAELAAIHLVHHDAVHPGDYAPADLQGAFGIPPASVVLGCDAHCQLTQIGFCLAKDAGDHPAGATPCTQNVTTSDYDNGCITRQCARVTVPACSSSSANAGAGGSGAKLAE